MGYEHEAIGKLNEIVSSGRQRAFEWLQSSRKGELFVLIYLYTNTLDKREAVLPSELSRALYSSTARVSAILKMLENKGEITREIDRSNRSNILVTLTESGRKRAKDAVDCAEESLTRVFGDMGEYDTKEFLRLTFIFLELLTKYHPSEIEKTPP